MIDTSQDFSKYIQGKKVEGIKIDKKEFYVHPWVIVVEATVTISGEEWEIEYETLDGDWNISQVYIYHKEMSKSPSGNYFLVELDKKMLDDIPGLETLLSTAAKEAYEELLEWLPVAKDMLEWYTLPKEGGTDNNVETIK